MDKLFSFGGMYTKISGECAEARAIQEYFKDVEVTCNQRFKEQFIIRVLDKKEEFTRIKWDMYSLSGSFGFNETSFYGNTSQCYYQVINFFNNEIPVLEIVPKRIGNMTRLMRTMNSMSIGVHTIGDEFVNRFMSYESMWFFMALVMLKYDINFVHGGVFTINDGTYLVSGTGGCGKTSTHMCALDKWNSKYVADDFCIVGNKGYTYFFPKRIALYESDAKFGSDTVKKAIRSLRVDDRLKWSFYKFINKNCRGRFDMIRVLGIERIEFSSKISRAFYFSRSNVNSIRKEMINIDSYCRKVMDASFRELKQIFEVLQNIRAVGGERYYSFYPSVEELQSKYIKILKKNLSNIELYNIELPLHCSPNDIINELVI